MTSLTTLEELKSYSSLMDEVIEKTEKLNELQSSSLGVEFYTIQDVCKMLGCSLSTAQKLFNDPEFPCENYTKEKKISKPEFIKYFSVRRDKNKSSYWRSIA